MLYCIFYKTPCAENIAIHWDRNRYISDIGVFEGIGIVFIILELVGNGIGSEMVSVLALNPIVIKPKV